MNLQEIDSAKITILVDNITDRLLPSSSLVKRPPMVSNQKIARAPISEHGFSIILEISYTHRNTVKHNKFLFDTGVSKDGIVNNSDVLGIRLSVHVYANNSGEAIEQAFKTYLNAKIKAIDNKIPLAPVDSK